MTIPVSHLKLHAKRSPSSSSRWTVCHAAPQREAAIPGAERETTEAADTGTVVHDLAEKCLTGGDVMLEMALGKDAFVQGNGAVVYCAPKNDGLGIRVTDELCDLAHQYAEFVRGMEKGGTLMVEQRLSIEHITGEPGAAGTSDTVILYDDEICVIDLKAGFKKVFAKQRLDAMTREFAPAGVPADGEKPNTQLVMYAEAARRQFEFWGPFKRVRIIIVMPRLGFVDEHVMTIEEFDQWVEWIKEQAEASRGDNPRVVPGVEQCTYCRAWPCPEAERAAVEMAIGDFDTLETAEAPALPDRAHLGLLKRKVPLLRMFADWVDSQVHAELSAGHPVPGWKLVQGDRGDRAWTDADKARDTLAEMLPRERYIVEKVISPAQVNEMVVNKRATAKRVLTQEQWDRLQGLITRPAPGKKVVPEDDPREAIDANAAGDFDDLTEPEQATGDDLADFFNT